MQRIVPNEEPPQVDPGPTVPNQSKTQRLLDSRPAILLLLFAVTGFLGIPLLLKSNAFSPTEKLVWSVAVTVYTCLLIAAVAAVVWWSYTNIRDAMSF